jgi:hypothetical protein
MFDDFELLITGLNKLVTDIEKSVPRAVIDQALPPAIHEISDLARESFRSKLPDGVASGTRALQTATTAERFPGHMKEEVETKIIRDGDGILAISGVTRNAGQVNFDFGEKAKTVGRRHILWGRGPANPPMRIQRQELQDIPGRVRDEVEPKAANILNTAVTKAIQSAT